MTRVERQATKARRLLPTKRRKKAKTYLVNQG